MADSFNLEYYDRKKHYDMLCSWWRDWDKPIVKPQRLPQFGVIAHRDGIYYAALFLVRKENLCCELEYAISSKEALKNVARSEREEIGILLPSFLTKLAKEMGYEVIQCNAATRYGTVIKYLKRLGFTEQKTSTKLLSGSLL